MHRKPDRHGGGDGGRVPSVSGRALRCGPVLPGGTLGRAPPRSLTPGSSGWQLASLEAAAQEGGELGGLLWHPPPLSLSSCPGSVSQRREQNVYKPLPLFEAHFRSTRELLRRKAITLLSIKQNKHHNGTECPPQKRFKAPAPTPDARWGAGTGSKPGGAAQWWVSRHSGHQKGQRESPHPLLARPPDSSQRVPNLS